MHIPLAFIAFMLSPVMEQFSNLRSDLAVLRWPLMSFGTIFRSAVETEPIFRGQIAFLEGVVIKRVRRGEVVMFLLCFVRIALMFIHSAKGELCLET